MTTERESILASILRSFGKVFFSIAAVFLAIGLSSLLFYSMSTSPYARKEKTVLNVLPDLNGNEELVSPLSPAILRIDIHGVIGGSKDLDTKSIESILRDSRVGILGNNRVKGILLHFNTPGGGVFDSANIYQMLKEYKEKYNVPVFAYVNGLCASGGMYIASAADRTFASPNSIVGSIGVISPPYFNFSELLEKIGVQSKTLMQGLNKDAMNAFRPWKPNEDAALQPIFDYFYKTFVDVVTVSRPRLDKDKLMNEYGAKIFDAPAGVEVGLIDVCDVDYNTTLHELLMAANIDVQKPYQVVELAPKTNWFEKIMEGSASMMSGRVEHVISFGSQHQAISLKDPFAYLYSPGISQ